MLIGLVMPLLRRVAPRTRIAIAVGLVGAGTALVLLGAVQGGGFSQTALFIRIGLLLTVAGLGLLVSGLRSHRRGAREERHERQ